MLGKTFRFDLETASNNKIIEMTIHLSHYVNSIENWPMAGVTFRDISPLLANHEAFHSALHQMRHNFSPQYWVGIESRGFVFASAMSQLFGGGVLLIRKSGKLPPPTIQYAYTLEYGSDVLEIHPGNGGSVVIVDDVLATGGTLSAAYELCVKAGYDIQGISILIDLLHLHPKPFTLGHHQVHSVLQYSD